MYPLSHKCEIIWNRISFERRTKSILLSDPHTTVFSYYYTLTKQQINMSMVFSISFPLSRRSHKHTALGERERCVCLSFLVCAAECYFARWEAARGESGSQLRTGAIKYYIGTTPRCRRALTLIAKGGCCSCVHSGERSSRRVIPPSPNTHTQRAAEAVYRFAISLLLNHSSKFHDRLPLYIMCNWVYHLMPMCNYPRVWRAFIEMLECVRRCGVRTMNMKLTQ